MSTAPAKVCQICHQDCSKKPRVKDPQGRYSCEECVAQRQAEAALLAGADPTPGVERRAAAKPAARPAPAKAATVAEGTPAGFWDQPAAAPAPVAAAQTRCAQCGNGLTPGAVICTLCGFNAQSGRKLKVKTGVDGGVTAGGVAAGAGKGAARFLLWLLGGGIAGGIGLGIWLALAIFANIEVGIVAIGVGALIGAGVAVTGQKHLNAISGAVAAAIAFFCVAGWKIAFYFILTAGVNAAPQLVTGALESELKGPNGDEVALEYYVYTVATDLEGKGQKGVWPEGLEAAGTDERQMAALEEYPEKVQKETQSRWAKLSPTDRDAVKQKIIDEARAEMQAASQTAQAEMKSAITAREIAFSILWTVLACGAAFSIGSKGFGG